jgi:pimeloyl-ACP methyl ester carboxylesterase
MKTQNINYKTVNVEGINVFYREAGDRSKPHIILLNGVPDASSAFQELMEDLKEDFYLVAPDFPGFGNSEVPSQDDYEYTFDNLSLSVQKFIKLMALKSPVVYAIGYGGPIAFRIAVRKPELFSSFILQNTNAYEEGFGPAMLYAAPFLENRNEHTEELAKPLFTLEGIKMFFLSGVRDVTNINPDGYLNAAYHLSQPGQQKIHLDILYDFRMNIAEYPKWQNFLKEKQPRMLLVWGKNDVFFPLPAAEAIKRDVPSAELHAYDTSHLALGEHHSDIAEHIKAFLK